MKNKVLTLRECSNVRRCHIVPHVGEYTVGKHCYDAAMLLLHLYPGASRNLLTAVLCHDLGERWVGDLPCTAAWDNGELGRAYHAAESAALGQHEMPQPQAFLDVYESRWLWAIDKLELWLWAQDQVHRWGNLGAQPVLDRLDAWFKDFKDLPAPVRNCMDNYAWEP